MTVDDQSLFADSEIPDVDQSKDYFTELVGEGKKYKTQADLAKGAVYKDAHIARLEAEAKQRNADLEALKIDLGARTRLEELMDNITSKESKVPSSDGNQSREPAPSSQAQTPQQLEDQIDALLSKRESERKANANRAIVKEKLVEKLGPSYANKVREQGRALGLGENFLNSLAAENPAAFFKLVGITDAPTNRQNIFSTPPPSDFNPDAGFTPTDSFQDKAYFDKLRKEKGDRVYWSPEVQSRLHKNAAADPIRFGLTDS